MILSVLNYYEHKIESFSLSNTFFEVNARKFQIEIKGKPF